MAIKSPKLFLPGLVPDSASICRALVDEEQMLAAAPLFIATKCSGRRDTLSAGIHGNPEMRLCVESFVLNLRQSNAEKTFEKDR